MYIFPVVLSYCNTEFIHVKAVGLLPCSLFFFFFKIGEMHKSSSNTDSKQINMTKLADTIHLIEIENLINRFKLSHYFTEKKWKTQ